MDKRKNLVLKSVLVTEKASVLRGLAESESNKSVARCKNVKYVFVVDLHSNKHQIKEAVERIYSDQNVKVVKVNVINIPAKKKRPKKSKMRVGRTSRIKKAVVTLREGDQIEMDL